MGKAIREKNNPLHLDIGLNAAEQPLTRSASGLPIYRFYKI